MRLPAAVLVLVIAANAGAAENGVRLPPAERIVLDNGAVLILSEKHDVPLIGVQAMLDGGAVTDPAGKAGLASLVAALLEKGAGDRDAAGFAEAVDAAGGRLRASGGLEHMSVAGDFLARDAGMMVELLADMLMRPALDAAEFDELRENRIDLIRAEKRSSPGGLLPVYAHALLFAGHPFAAPVDGSESSLAAIGHRDVLDYYQSHVGADRLVIAVCGDFDAARMAALLESAFGGWRRAFEPLPEMPAAAAAPGGRVLLVDKPDATQTWFWIGGAGVSRTYEARAALDVANTLLGGRSTSLLNTALQVETGLADGARSVLVRPSEPGSVAIDSSSRTEATTEAIDLALDVLGRFRATPPSAAAVESAKNHLLGRFPLRLETARQLAAQFATIETSGLARDRVDGYADAVGAVEAADVAAVADAVYPAREDAVFVLIGDARRIRDAVAKYGSVTEMSITEPVFRPRPAEGREADGGQSK